MLFISAFFLRIELVEACSATSDCICICKGGTEIRIGDVDVAGYHKYETFGKCCADNASTALKLCDQRFKKKCSDACETYTNGQECWRGLYNHYSIRSVGECGEWRQLASDCYSK